MNHAHSFAALRLNYFSVKLDLRLWKNQSDIIILFVRCQIVFCWPLLSFKWPVYELVRISLRSAELGQVCSLVALLRSCKSFLFFVCVYCNFLWFYPPTICVTWGGLLAYLVSRNDENEALFLKPPSRSLLWCVCVSGVLRFDLRVFSTLNIPSSPLHLFASYFIALFIFFVLNLCDCFVAFFFPLLKDRSII